MAVEYGLEFPGQGGAGDFKYHRLALPDASFAIKDLVHYRSTDDTAWKILSQTVAAVPAVPAALTHSQLTTGIRIGYNFLAPANRDPIPTVTTTGYIFFNTTTNGFRKLDAGAFRAFQGVDTNALATNTVLNGKTFAGSFQTQFAAISAGADAEDHWYYNINENDIRYWVESASVFRVVGGGGIALTFPAYFGSTFIWLQSVHSPSDLDDYFDNNQGNAGRRYYWYNTVTSEFNVSQWLPANFWEDVDIDWVLNSDDALFLGDNGVAGTENLDEPDDVEAYLDIAGNYDATKTYIFHNQINATIPTGTSPRFTSSQSSSFQGEGPSASRPTADSLDIHDWWYNTTTRQLQYVATSGGNNIWLIATSNVLLDIFFPSVGYTWAGRTGDGPYEQQFEYTIAEIYRAIADGNIDYDSNSPLVFFDTNNNQLRYVSNYTAPNYGRIDEVTAFTASVPEVPAFDRPIWDEVLESSGGAVAQTEAEIRTLLSFTAAEQADTITDATLAAGILTFTQEDGTTIPITLPSGADGLVTEAAYDASTNVLTLTRSGTLTPITVDLSDLVDEFADEQSIEYISPGNLSGVNALTGVVDGVTAYEDGMGVAFVAETSNSGAMTLRLNSLPFRSIRDVNGDILTQNAIAIGKLVIAFYQSSSNSWRSNIYVPQDLSGKVDRDLQNIASLNAQQSANARASIGAATNQLASTSNDGLMPATLVQILQNLNNADPVDTESEIRALIGFTVAEQQETITGVPTLSGNVLTFTHEDGTTTQITLPNTPGTTDGVVTGVAFNTTTRVLTLTRSGGLDPLTEDLSALQDERIGEQIHFISDPALISGTNSITLTIPGVQTYEDGLGVAFIAENANTGAVAIGVNTLSTTVARRSDNTVFTGGEITVGKLVTAFYDDTVDRWRTNVRPPIDIAGKANTDLGNLDTDLTTNEQAAIQQKLNVPDTQFAGPSNAGLMPSNLYNKLSNIESGATADQTETEIRNLLSFTAAEQADTVTGVSLSNNVLTFTQEDGGTFDLTLPTTTGAADGLVTDATFDAATRIVTLTRSGTLTPLTFDLSDLANTEGVIFVDGADVVEGGDGVTLMIPSVTAYTDALFVAFRYPAANAGTIAIQVNALGGRSARRRDSGIFQGGEITQNQLIFAIYDLDDTVWRTDADINPTTLLNRNLSNPSTPTDAHAKTFREAIQVPKSTTGAAFPTDPSIGDIHEFDVEASGLSSVAVNNAASAILSNAGIGDTFKFSTVGVSPNEVDRWVLEVEGLTRSEVEGIVSNEVSGSVASGVSTKTRLFKNAAHDIDTFQVISLEQNINDISLPALLEVAVEHSSGRTSSGLVPLKRYLDLDDTPSNAPSNNNETLLIPVGRLGVTTQNFFADANIFLYRRESDTEMGIVCSHDVGTTLEINAYELGGENNLTHLRAARQFNTGSVSTSTVQVRLTGTGTTRVLHIHRHTDLPVDFLEKLRRTTEVIIRTADRLKEWEGVIQSVVTSPDDNTNASITILFSEQIGTFVHNENIIILFGYAAAIHVPDDEVEVDATEFAGLFNTDDITLALVLNKLDDLFGRTFYWMHGQTERIGTIVVASQLGDGNRRARFDSTQRQQSRGGIGSNVVGFVASGDVNANADLIRTGETFSDGEFFTVNGKLDLFYQAHTRADDDQTFVARLVKVQSGTDDILLQEATSSAKAAQVSPTAETVDPIPVSAIGNTVELEYKSLESDGTEQFSIQLLGFHDTLQSGVQGFMMMEKA